MRTFSSHITLATWNVNSIKSRLHAVTAWLQHARPDVVMLQELKCTTDSFPYEAIESLGYNVLAHGQKTYNGVAILSRFRIEDGHVSLIGDPDPLQARYIEAVISLPTRAFRVASVYVPNGQDPLADKFSYKLSFFDALHEQLKQWLRYDEPCILGGDFNVAPTPLDVYNARALEGSICFHPEEQARFRGLTYLGYTDAFRALHPDEVQFSWWDYRARAWEQNHGMRIDHLLLSPQATDLLCGAGIDHDVRGQEKASDHVPVWCKLAV